MQHVTHAVWIRPETTNVSCSERSLDTFTFDLSEMDTGITTQILMKLARRQPRWRIDWDIDWY